MHLEILGIVPRQGIFTRSRINYITHDYTICGQLA